MNEILQLMDRIDRISLSPWMPARVEPELISLLRSIDDCADICISRSTLVDNERWKSVVKGAANGMRSTKRLRPVKARGSQKTPRGKH